MGLFEKVEIGINDVSGRAIKNGDRLRVRHINYKGTDKEFVDEEFIARVAYSEFQAMFQYYPENDDEHEGYVFNHRISEFEIID